MSRPSSFSENVSNTICDLLSEGHSLVTICERDGMPNRATVMRWLESKSDFAARVSRAREEQGDFVHDEMARIESDVLAGLIPPDVARVVISSKQWRASKLAPKKYGDKTTIDATSVVKVEHTRRLNISTLSDNELDVFEKVLRETVAQLGPPAKTIEHEE